MDNLHRLLKRQMNKYLEDVVLTDELHAFIFAVNQAYIDHDKDRLLLERSIEISAREYHEKMDKIRILQGQLVQQEKLAGIGQLSAGIAHEINNPLGYAQSNLATLKKYLDKIKGFLQTVAEAEKDLQAIATEPEQKILQRIEHARQKNKIDLIMTDLDDLMAESASGLVRIERIVKSLLGFARHRVNTFEDYDLNQGILDTLAIVNNKIKYLAAVDQDLGNIPCIQAMGGLINQVLLNLIMNAIQAIQDKSVKGILAIKTFEKDGSVYCLITDNGIGIPKTNLEHIFTPFFTTKPVGMGTGLGLSIAYDIIVNKHAGEITLDSAEGVGTTFILRLPVQQEKNVVGLQ
jgi:two-component system, NtrC family, sensor kinase